MSMVGTEGVKDSLDNWGPDVLKMPVLKLIDGSLPEFGEIFTDTFAGYAGEKGRSYVLIHYPANKPEECVLDQANASKKNVLKALEHILEAEKGEN